MAKQRTVYAFTVEVDGKTYECERTVEGTGSLTQVIRVKGIGTKSDSASYGSNGHPPRTMESVAKLIAREIISENGET